MARLKRLRFCNRIAYVYSHTLPEITLTEEDRSILLDVLKTYTQKNGYVEYYTTLLPESFHTLTQFYEDKDCSLQPKILKQEMTRAYNQHHKRRGTIWWDRYDDLTVVGQDQVWKTQLYLACFQTRAGLVDSPLNEKFSSFAAYVQGIDDGMTTILPQYIELGDTPQDRQAAFLQMVMDALALIEDPQAYVQAQHAHQGHRLDPSWAEDLRRLECYEKRHLEKRREQLTLVIVTPASQEEVSEDQIVPQAMAEVQDLDPGTLLSKQEHDQLICLGIPEPVIRKFFAPKGIILDMVRLHFKIYRLYFPP